jgi:hypothetical protein
MTVRLHRRVLFTGQFRDRLIGDGASQRPSASPATIYYRQWLAALEKLLLDKALLAKADLDARAEELLSGERG